jgi:hypothetical protein
MYSKDALLRRLDYVYNSYTTITYGIPAYTIHDAIECHRVLVNLFNEITWLTRTLLCGDYTRSLAT